MTYSLDTIVARAKRRAFAFPGSDIYGWLANAWDLGLMVHYYAKIF